jgi:uncharacterized protein YqhQ
MSKKYSAVGGQAIIEGVMMKGKEDVAIAVRNPDGEITLKMEKPSKIEKSFLLKIPVLRGSVALIASMIVGVKALSYSAEFYAEMEEGYETKGFEKWIYDKLGDKAEDVMVAFSMVFALIMAFTLFGALPTVIINTLKNYVESQQVLSFLEGTLKILMFITYVLVISRMKDVSRVFEYHGAEHKVIHCLESGQDLTVENARKFTTLHPRCGTSFLIIVFVISIIIFSFISWSSILVRIALKIVLLPVVAGLSYEIIKIAGKSDSPIVKAISFPGLMMQKLTTKEPDDKQLEVALAAMIAVLSEEQKASKKIQNIKVLMDTGDSHDGEVEVN